MVWELIKDSPGWRIAGWASLLYAAGWLVLSQGNHVGIMSGGPILIYLGLMGIVAQEPEVAHRCTFFDAALPVDGRRLWISKMIVLLGMLWLPVLAASVVGFTVLRDPALPLLQSAGGVTVILLFAQGFRIRQFQEPRLVCVLALIFGGGGMVALGSLFPEAGVLILSAYLLTSAVLFGINLVRVPKSFQSAREDEITPWSMPIPRSNPKLVWLKVLRPYYLWIAGLFIGFVWLTGGAVFMTVIGGVPPIIGMAKKNLPYLFSLPLSFAKLFRIIWAPAPVAMVIGYLLSQRFNPPDHRIALDGREPLVVFAMELALLFGWMFFFQAGQWRRLRNFPALSKAVTFLLFPIAMTAGWILIPSRKAWVHYSDPISYYAVQWTPVLPENPLLFALTLMLPVAGLYWLAEKSFCETEYSTQQTAGDAYLQKT